MNLPPPYSYSTEPSKQSKPNEIHEKKDEDDVRPRASTNVAPLGMQLANIPPQMVTDASTGEQTLLVHLTLSLPASNITTSHSASMKLQDVLAHTETKPGNLIPNDLVNSPMESHSDSLTPEPANTNIHSHSRQTSSQEPKSDAVSKIPSSSSTTTCTTKTNENPERYLEKLVASVTPKELTKLISKGDEFHQSVLKCLLAKYTFKGMPIDVALRLFLYNCALPPESQQIDRVMQAFAQRYHTENPDIFRDPDQVHIIAFAIVMLNSDLHNPAQRKKMSKDAFVGNIFYAVQKLNPNSKPQVTPRFVSNSLTTEPSSNLKKSTSSGAVNVIEEDTHFLKYGIPIDLPEIIYENISKEKLRYMEDENELSNVGWVIRPLPLVYYKGNRSTDLLSEVPQLEDIMAISYKCPLNLSLDILSLPTPGSAIQEDEEESMMLNMSISESHSRQASAASHKSQASGNDLAPPLVHHRRRSDSVNMSYPSTSMNYSPPKTFFGTNDRSSSKAKHLLLDILTKKIWEGKLTRKKEPLHVDQHTASKKGWKTAWVILSGAQLLFFDDWEWFESKRHLSLTDRIPMDHSCIPKQSPPLNISQSVIVYDPTYKRKPFVFHLYDFLGSCYMFQAESLNEMKEWMAHLNFAATFKTCGIRISLSKKDGKSLSKAYSVIQPSSGGLMDVDQAVNALSTSLPAKLILEEQHAEDSDGLQNAPSIIQVAAEEEEEELGTETMRARQAVIEMKTTELKESLVQIDLQLSQQQQLLRHLMLLQPLSRSSRSRLDQDVLKKMRFIKKLKIDQERVKCYLHYLHALEV